MVAVALIVAVRVIVAVAVAEAVGVRVIVAAGTDGAVREGGGEIVALGVIVRVIVVVASGVLVRVAVAVVVIVRVTVGVFGVIVEGVALGVGTVCAEAVNVPPPRYTRRRGTSEQTRSTVHDRAKSDRASRTSKNVFCERRACRADRARSQLVRDYITGFAILCQRVWRFFAWKGISFLT